ncbi:hypothetical protein FQN57_007012 [Myotisia sp. PD_48]|nr:hypothetical protein FQN57_007012 [Myotisia sp. PD_48]
MTTPPSNPPDPSSASTHNDATQPSPSPPPPAPVALTPGPRASRLQQVYSQALQRTIRANSYASFSACFPTPAKHVPHSLESVWRQLNAKLEESATAEFEDILHERNVIQGLNELDRMVGEARHRRANDSGVESRPPYTLSANELFQAHVAPILAQTQATLQSKVEEVQRQNEEIGERIAAQREEIGRLLATLENAVGDVQGAVKAIDEFDPEGFLRAEAEQMDDEARGPMPP